MRQVFISRNPSAVRLLLIFTGWSTDERYFSNLEIPGWDIMVCSGYSDMNFNHDLISGYPTIYVVAWSLGVTAAAHSLQQFTPAAAFAINGTETPVDDTCGIPRQIFFATLDSLSELSLRKFRRRMYASKDDFDAAGELFPSTIDIEQLRSQLSAISSLPPISMNWTRVFICGEDRIFPASNQLNFWNAHPSRPDICLMKETPHAPDMASLIEGIIPNFTNLGEGFSKAAPRYDTYASAQKQIAQRLADMLPPYDEEAEVLEIGPGTGFFTHIYSSKLKIRKAVFAELYDIAPFGIAEKEIYFKGDAEQALSGDIFPGELTHILSANTIQWFADPECFFANAARHLSPRGILACSTFAPGNLCELDGIRPSPIVYHSAERLREYASAHFDDVRIIEEEIVINFPDARNALIHLKNTGVASGHNYGITAGKLLRALSGNDGAGCRLTYKPVYIIAADPKRN